MLRIVLVVFAVIALAPAAAHALPEPYVGLGMRSVDLPGATGAEYAFAVEGGVDDVLSDLGAGIRVDLPDFEPVINAELRYSVLKLPFVRLLAAIGGGVERTSKSWDGTVSASVGARVSVGVPYLSAQVGVSSLGKWRPYSTVMLGLSF